jgi:phage gp29-like protein
MSTENPKFSAQAIERAKQQQLEALVDLTPERLKAARRAFRAGRLRELALIMDQQEETDDVLQSVAPKAKAAVARHGWEILTVDTEDEAQAARAALQKEVLEAFYNHLRVTSALDQDELGGVSLLLRQMMDAKGKRYAVHHIVWKPIEGGRYTATLWFVPLWFFENATGKMRFIENAYGYDGVPMEPGEWLVTKGQGIGIACASAWLLKHMPLRDWVALCHRFGDAIVEGLTDAAEGSPEWRALGEAVRDLQGGDAVVHSRGAEIKITTPGQLGSLPYPPLVERMDRALAALWRGADLSTMSAGGGEGTGASLQGEEADIIEQDDAAWLSETLQLKLDRLVLDNVFGPDEPALAYFRVATANKQNVDLDLRVDEFAVRNGHPISKKQFAERYSRPIPDAEDELLRAPAPVPASSGFGVSGSGFPPRPAVNERTVGAIARQAAFKAAAIEKLTAAQKASLSPLVDRLRAIAALPDDRFDAELAKLKRELPALYRTVLSDTTVAAAWEEILGSALVSGAAEKRQDLLPPPTS